jgi:hypothetical protein
MWLMGRLSTVSWILTAELSARGLPAACCPRETYWQPSVIWTVSADSLISILPVQTLYMSTVKTAHSKPTILCVLPISVRPATFVIQPYFERNLLLATNSRLVNSTHHHHRFSIYVRTCAAFRRVLQELHGPVVGWQALTYWGRAGIVPCVLNLGTSWRWVVRFWLLCRGLEEKRFCATANDHPGKFRVPSYHIL